MLSLTDYCLLTLATIYDALDNTPYNPTVATLDMFGLGPERPKRRVAMQKALAYLAKKRLVQKEAGEGRETWELTPLGRRRVREDYRLFWYRQQKWDGYWRLCLFDVPEKEKKIRYLMRRRLREWGFVMLQKSVWLSPFPFANRLEELFREEGLRDKYLLLTVNRLPSRQEKKLAESLWQLNKLAREYQALLETYRKAKTPEQRLHWRRRYLAVYTRDPQLPPRLLPANWTGFRARACYQHCLKPSSHSTNSKKINDR